MTKPSHVVILNMCKNKTEPMAESQTKSKVFLHIHKQQIMGASWCNLTDDVTICHMMTSLCVIELIMLGLV